MRKIAKTGHPASVEEIARMTDRGKDVSRFFTNDGKMMPPIHRVNVDFPAAMLKELDDEARNLNVSRQAVIKTLLRHALDQQNLAPSKKQSAA